MITRSRRVRPIPAVIALLFLFQGPAAAQDEVEPKADPRAAAEQARAAGMFAQAAFGNMGSEPAARARLETRLDLEIDRVDRVCSLTDDRKKKLALAGNVEIKRFFDKVDELRRRLENLGPLPVRRAPIPGPLKPIVESLMKEPLAGDGGSFEHAPLFQKVCKTTLTPEQTALYRADRLASRESACRVRVGEMIDILDATVGLTHDQRRTLTEILTEKTRRIRRYGDRTADTLAVANQAAKIPESKIKPLFSADQWTSVAQTLRSLKGMALMFALMIGPIDEPEPDLDAAAPLAEPAGP